MYLFYTRLQEAKTMKCGILMTKHAPIHSVSQQASYITSYIILHVCWLANASVEHIGSMFWS